MITIISGTNRKNSSSLRLARYYQHLLSERGTDSHLFSLEDLPADLLVSDLYGARSEAFTRILDQIGESRKIIFIIPEYNGSFPGVLKLFMDACEYPDSFKGKKVALVGVSGGKYGNVRGVDHFTGVCHYMQMNVLPLKIHIPHIWQELNEHGQLHKEDTVKFTNLQIDNFLEF